MATVNRYFLLEDGSYFLLEDGAFLIIDEEESPVGEAAYIFFRDRRAFIRDRELAIIEDKDTRAVAPFRDRRAMIPFRDKRSGNN